MNATDAATAVVADPETSLLAMFWSAHIVVKIVMLGLLAASFWSWTIIVNKTLLFAKFRRAMESFEQVFWSGQSLEELYGALSQRANSGAASLFISAMRGINILGLKDEVLLLLKKEFVEETIRVRQDQQKLISQLHSAGEVLERIYEDEEVVLRMRIRRKDRERVESLIHPK